MRPNQPDFFIHSGDPVYADNRIPAEQALPDGGVWKNAVLEEKSKVAKSLSEFRANYKHNDTDENVRRFNAEVSKFAQWADHEVVNNRYPGEILESADRHTAKSASLLAALANRAFMQFLPLRTTAAHPERI